MNIFYLDRDPKTCAEMHCDKHVVKMIIEYAQLMSTSHRILDGTPYIDLTKNGRKIKRWRMNDPDYDTGLMLACHVNHPSNLWLRANKENYEWLYSMWVYLLDEYTHRYGKIHACQRVNRFVMNSPKNIPVGEFFSPTPAMPDDCKVPNNSLESYHKYYRDKKSHFAKWTKREIPLWYVNRQNANIQI